MFSELIREVPETKQQQKISRVVLGLGYIAVEVEGSGVGLCANILPEEKTGCTVFPRAGSLKGSRVSDLLELGLKGDLLGCSGRGHAVSNQEKDSGVEQDVFEAVAVRRREGVMVGFIARWLQCSRQGMHGHLEHRRLTTRESGPGIWKNVSPGRMSPSYRDLDINGA